MSAPRRVAIVGAGDMGARHAEHWRAAGADIVAICDPNQDRASALAARFGARAEAEPLEAVRAADLDVVSVCTPTYLHAPVTIAALEAGRDVLCEKPVALTLEDAQAMAEAERRSGRRLRIGFMRRFDPLWRKVQTDLSLLGGPLMAHATLAAGVRPKLLMHDAQANGGPVIDMACHLFDRWERVFGVPPRTVRARGHTFGADKPELRGLAHVAVDTVQVTLDYGDAGAAQIQLSWGLPAGVPPVEHHSYVAPGGLVQTDGGVATLVRGPEATTYVRPDVDAWREEIAAFTRELDGGDPQGLADVQAGIRALRSSLAVLEAVQTRATVVIDGEPAGEPAGSGEPVPAGPAS